MRIATCLSLLLLAAALAPSLNGQDPTTEYYPLKVGNRWTYRSGPQQQQVVIEVEKRELLSVDFKRPGETKVAKDHKLAAYVLRITSGDKAQTEQVAIVPHGSYKLPGAKKEIELADGVYKFQVAGKEVHPPLCFLKLGTKQGESWEVNSESEGVTIKGTFTIGVAAVSVPAGAFPNTLTTKTKDLQAGAAGVAMECWFAQNVGLAKQTVQVSNGAQTTQTTLELLKFEPGR